MTDGVKNAVFQIYEFAAPFLPFAVIWWMLFVRYGEKTRRNAANLAILFVYGLYVAEVFHITGSGTLYDLLRTGIDVHGNVIPFAEDNRNLIGYALNTLMLTPFGFLLPMLWKDCRGALRVTAAGAAFSLLIELSQLLNFRSPDVDDLIFNTLGAWIGYGVYKLLPLAGSRFDIGRRAYFPAEWALCTALLFAGRFVLFDGLGAARLLYGF